MLISFIAGYCLSLEKLHHEKNHLPRVHHFLYRYISPSASHIANGWYKARGAKEKNTREKFFHACNHRQPEKKAGELLNTKPFSVMDKEFTPVSGDKHDYMSQAPYFWYDSSRPNGLPYLRRDGQHNPEIKKITDRTYIGNLENITKTLSLAWYLTGEEKYAAKSAALIRNWFFNPATRMNPNLEYAQAIPGINNGRGIGIIETRTLTGIADAAMLLQNSKSWSQVDTKQLKEWYAQYLNWLLTSKNGKDEHAAKNNHGTWFYMQAIYFALFTDNKQKALELVDESKKLLDNQLAATGQWPLELERTNALGYSTFNTSAWFQVATLAEKLGVDLWHYKTSRAQIYKRRLIG